MKRLEVCLWILRQCIQVAEIEDVPQDIDLDWLKTPLFEN